MTRVEMILKAKWKRNANSTPISKVTKYSSFSPQRMKRFYCIKVKTILQTRQHLSLFLHLICETLWQERGVLCLYIIAINGRPDFC